MGRKIDDLTLTLMNDSRIRFAALFIVLVLVIWGLTRDTPHGRVRHPDESASKPAQGAEGAYGDLIYAFQSQLKESKDDQAEMKAVLTRTNSKLEENKERFTGIIENFVDRFEQLSREVDNLASVVSKPQESPLAYTKTPETPEEGIESFGGELPPPPPFPLPPRRHRVSMITPGASVDVMLLTGVYAPVDGAPYPVVFEFGGPIRGPNGLTLDLGEAQLLASAQGAAGNSRAIFRLASLTIGHPSGRVSVVKVDGWIIGEDGIEGMKGALVDKLGRLIVATAAVSGAAALGNRVDGGSGSYQRSGQPGFGLSVNDVDAAAATALSHASDRLGKVLIDRYESFVPVVEILSHRQAVAIFSQPAEISVLEDEEGGAGEVLAAGYGE